MVLHWAHRKIYDDIQYSVLIFENLLELVGEESKHQIDLGMGLSLIL